MSHTQPMHQIRASAGSGKTYAITSRFLLLLQAATQDPDAASGCAASSMAGYNWQEIMAVTFTNAAATEMRERILERLKLMALDQWDGDPLFNAVHAKRWIAAILSRLHGLNVRTIDSLLHTVVRLSALELRLPPDFEPIFGTDELILPLLDTLLEDARTDETMQALLHEACRQTVFHMPNFTGFQAGANVRKEIVNLTMPLYREGLPYLADANSLSARYADLSRHVREAGTAMSELVNAEKLNAKKHFLDALAVCRGLGAQSPCPTSVMLRKLCLDECLNKASKEQASPDAEAAFRTLYTAIFNMETDGRLLRAGLRLAPYAALAQVLAAALRVHLQSAGQVPLELMPSLAEEALEQGMGVSETFCRMGAALRHMLIDEFQDTSRAQWLAMRPLVQELLAHGGSLTWVGDVKQAVYGWRGGDATLFDAVSREEALTCIVPVASRENLPMNRRSRAEIVQHNNRIFSRLADKACATEVLRRLLPEKTPQSILTTASDLLCGAFDNAEQEPSPDKPGGFVQLTFITAEPDGFSNDALTDCTDAGVTDTRALEDAREANDLNNLVHQNLLAILDAVLSRRTYGDVAVLTRSNKQVETVATWLMQHNLPVVTDSSFRLASHPLVVELLSLLGFLNNPDNNPAFVALVCGPRLFLPCSGQTFADMQDWLVRVAERRHRGDATPLHLAFQEDFPNIWARTLAPFVSNAGLTTPYDTVREALNHFGAWERCADQLVFMQRFLEVLHEAEINGHGSFSAFLDYWAAHGADEKAPMPDSVNAIRVMTVHKSKGLEFPVVICPWLDIEPKATRDPRLEILPAAAGFPEQLMVARPASGMDSYFQSLADNAREALHRLYVAWTRAGEELYTFVTAKKSTEKGRAALCHLLDLPAHSDETINIDALVLEYGEPQQAPVASTPPSPVPATVPTVVGNAQPELTQPQNAQPIPAHAEHLPEMENWRPLHWMPRLKIFRSPLRALAFTPERRGTFVHHCLEHLRLTGNPTTDAALAVARGLADFPVPLAEPELARTDLTQRLEWYAALPEAEHWMRHGTAEQSMWDSEGKLLRADLLVNDGQTLTVVDYKTGAENPAHHEQVQTYMAVLSAVQALPVCGRLVYLDMETVREVPCV